MQWRTTLCRNLTSLRTATTPLRKRHGSEEALVMIQKKLKQNRWGHWHDVLITLVPIYAIALFLMTVVAVISLNAEPSVLRGITGGVAHQLPRVF